MDEFVRLYSKIAADFKGAEDSAPLHLLEQHPYLMEKISHVWGTREADPFLAGVMIADRMGREGFSDRVAAELVFMKHLHAFVYDMIGTENRRVEDLIHRIAKPRSMRDLVVRYGIGSTPPPSPVIEPLRERGWGEISSTAELRKEFSNSSFQRRRKIGAILVENIVITEAELDEALKVQSTSGIPRKYLGEILHFQGKVSDQDIEKALCLQENLLLVDLDAIPMAHEAFSAVNYDLATENGFIPLLKIGGNLIAAIESPTSKRSMMSWNEISRQTKLNIKMCWADPNAIIRRLQKYQPGRAERK